MKWEHILIIILVVALVYFWITWPKPKVDERVQEYQHVIDEQKIVIDSLHTLMELESIEIDKQKEQFDSAASAFRKTISRQHQQLNKYEDIHKYATPELDSIVRELYGEGAI